MSVIFLLRCISLGVAYVSTFDQKSLPVIIICSNDKRSSCSYCHVYSYWNVNAALANNIASLWAVSPQTVIHTPWVSCPLGPSWAESLPPGVWSHSRRNNGMALCYICHSWSEGTPAHRTGEGHLHGAPHTGRTPVNKDFLLQLGVFFKYIIDNSVTFLCM